MFASTSEDATVILLQCRGYSSVDLLYCIKQPLQLTLASASLRTGEIHLSRLQMIFELVQHGRKRKSTARLVLASYRQCQQNSLSCFRCLTAWGSQHLPGGPNIRRYCQVDHNSWHMNLKHIIWTETDFLWYCGCQVEVTLRQVSVIRGIKVLFAQYDSLLARSLP